VDREWHPVLGLRDRLLPRCNLDDPHRRRAPARNGAYADPAGGQWPA
jgi:hypothetical protein